MSPTKYRVPLLAVCFSSFILHPSSFILAQEVRWRHDYNAARREAAERRLPLLLDFETDRCLWCQKLDATTFRDPTVVALLNESVVPLKVDGHKSAALVELLRIQAYPTLVLAESDGKIFDTVEGYVEADRLRELVQKLLTAAETSARQTRDYQEAVSAIDAAEFGQAVVLLRRVLQAGHDRPVQTKARKLLQEVERQAATRLARLKELAELGQGALVVDALPEFTRTFAGAPAAEEAATWGKQLAARPDVKARQRERRARELVLQAREDFQAKRFLTCLERCEQLTAQFADLPESAEAGELAAAIKDHPERLQRVCEGLHERLGSTQLMLAESLLKQGRPAEAAAVLEQVVQKLPGSRPAEKARARLEQLQGLLPRDGADGPKSAEEPR